MTMRTFDARYSHDCAAVSAPIIRICALRKLCEDGQVAEQIGGLTRRRQSGS